MGEQMTTPGIKVGQTFETSFFLNPKSDSPHRFRATTLNGKRAPKAIFCSDPEIQPGKLCKVRVTSIKSPASKNRGFIEVEFLGRVDFKLDKSFYVDPILVKKLQALLECGKNILLDGPQGSGKTVLSRNIAEALDIEYVFFNCSSAYEATDFLATLQLKATEGGATVTEWIETDILRALTEANNNPEKRFLIFLDEFNRCREFARNGIMPALDSTRRLYNPIDGRTIHIPDNVLWIAAINNGAQFTGTTSVDPAQLDRFAPLKISYLPQGEEIRVLSQRYPAVSKKDIERIVTAANAVRKDKNLRVDLSVRATEEVCSLLSHPNFSESLQDPLYELLQTSFCARYQGNWDDPSSDAGLVWQVISRTLV